MTPFGDFTHSWYAENCAGTRTQAFKDGGFRTLRSYLPQVGNIPDVWT